MRRTPSTTTSAALLAASLLLGACARSQPGIQPAEPAASEIASMLHASAASWTEGDLDGFLDDYAPDATFVGSSGLTRGRAQIREAYVRGYWSTGAAADGLRFELLEVRTTGRGAAVAVGRYELFDRNTQATTAAGLFSLVLERRDGQWRIVHDHSSADPSE